MFMIDFSNDYKGMAVPKHTQQTLNDYFLKGWRPGSFIESMLAYDYETALYKADSANRAAFWAIAVWIRENSPEGSHGNYEMIDAWVKDSHGLRTEFEKKYMWETLK
jgi:hypothetical protein